MLNILKMEGEWPALEILSFFIFCDVAKHQKLKYLCIFEQKYLGIWLSNISEVFLNISGSVSIFLFVLFFTENRNFKNSEDKK